MQQLDIQIYIYSGPPNAALRYTIYIRGLPNTPARVTKFYQILGGLKNVYIFYFSVLNQVHQICL